MQDQLLTLLSSSQQPSSPGGGGGGTLGNHLGGSPPSIFTSRQPSLLPTLSRTPHSPPMSPQWHQCRDIWVNFRTFCRLCVWAAACVWCLPNGFAARRGEARSAPQLCLQRGEETSPPQPQAHWGRDHCCQTTYHWIQVQTRKYFTFVIATFCR